MAPVHPAPSASGTASDEAPTAAGPIEDRIHSVVSLPSDPIVLGPPRIGPDPSELARRYADLTVDELVSAWKGVDTHYQAEVEAHFDAMEADGRALEVPMPVYDGPQAGLRGMAITANRYADRIVKCWQSIEDPGGLVELLIDPEERPDLYGLDFECNWLLQEQGLRGGVLPF